MGWTLREPADQLFRRVTVNRTVTVEATILCLELHFFFIVNLKVFLHGTSIYSNVHHTHYVNETVQSVLVSVSGRGRHRNLPSICVDQVQTLMNNYIDSSNQVMRCSSWLKAIRLDQVFEGMWVHFSKDLIKQHISSTHLKTLAYNLVFYKWFFEVLFYFFPSSVCSVLPYFWRCFLWLF